MSTYTVVPNLPKTTDAPQALFDIVRTDGETDGIIVGHFYTYADADHICGILNTPEGAIK